MFIERELAEGTIPLSLDDDLLASGLIDSMGLMQLIAFLENHFGVEIDDADITTGNFRSVRSIASLLASYPEAT